MANSDDNSETSRADRLELAAGFPAATDEAWAGLVRRIVGAADPEEALARHTYDGVSVKPLYTARDWPAGDELAGFPGFAPFTRGHRVAGQVKDGWDVRQRHLHPDRSECNRQILEDLAKGVTSIELKLDRAGRLGVDGDAAGHREAAGVGGVMVGTIDDLDAILAGVYLDACPVAIDAGAAFLPVSVMMIELLARRRVEPAAFAGAFNADPIGALAGSGHLPGSLENALDQLGALARHVATVCPAATAVGVDATLYHDAGASEAQELACAMAAGTAYLRTMEAAGLDLETAFRQIAFTFSTDANLFLSVAKLRAARRLWGRIAEACGVPRAVRGMRLHVSTSSRIMSRRDPWVNILRGTIAALGAAIGGADSLTVLPFTAAIGHPDATARRIARNTQLVLQQESSMSRVIDPAGGSWAIENQSDALAREGWRLFQEIEGQGGMTVAVRAGRIRDSIAETAAARARHVADLSDPLTGTSAFPNLAEAPVAFEAVDLETLRARAATDLSLQRKRSASSVAAGISALRGGEMEALVVAAAECARGGATLGTIVEAAARGDPARAAAMPCRRLGAPFEALRDASDACFEKSGRRPTAYLAAIGPLARFAASAAFARNSLASGGIDAVTGDGGDDAEAIAQGFGASGTDVAVICSDGDGLRDLGPRLAAALARAGAREIHVAAAPEMAGDIFEGLPIAGYLYAGCDVLAVLQGMMERMGILQR